MKKKNKKILGGLIFAFLIFSFLPRQIYAQSLAGIIGGIGANVILDIVGGLGYISGFFSGLFLQLVMLIGNLSLQLQNFIISNPFVEIGWRIVRDVANLGFVLIIIVIALATILRREQYGAQKLLPRLIAAAILVNFSLTLAGIFINFTQIATNYFFSKISAERSEIFGRLGGALNPQKYFSSPEIGSPGGIDDFSEQSLNRAISPWFISIFNTIAAFVLLTLAILLMIRFFYISFLLITSPIVWLFWVIPDLSGQFSKWWKDFINWAIFAPAAAFFVYLAFAANSQLSKFELNGATVGGSLRAQGMNPLVASILIPGVNSLLLIGLLIGGMIAAKNIAPKGAQGVIGFANKVGIKTAKWAGKKAGNRALTAGSKTNDKGETTTALERFGASKMARIPLVGRAVTAISGASSKARFRMAGEAKKKTGDLEHRTPEDLENMINRSTPMMSPEKLSALAVQAAKKGVKWSAFDLNKQKRIIEALQKTNSGDAILAYMPSLANKFHKTVDEAMSKYVKDATTLSKEELAHPQIARNLKPAHRTQLGNNGTEEQKKAVINNLETQIDQTVIDNLNTAKKEMDKQQKAIADAQAKGDKKEVENAILARDFARDEIKNITTALTAEQKKALEVYESIQENTSWRDVIKKP